MRPSDNGWPTRPVQSTLDNYIGNRQMNGQQQPHDNHTQQSNQWGNHPTQPSRNVGPGPPPVIQTHREHTPLKYIDA
jgi:hypothetical protein